MAPLETPDVVSRGRSELNARGGAAAEYAIRVGATVHVANRHDLRAKILSALDDLGVKHVVLDASATGFIDSAGIGMLVSATRRLRESGGSLVIEGLSTDMRELLRLSKIDLVLEVR